MGGYPWSYHQPWKKRKMWWPLALPWALLWCMPMESSGASLYPAVLSSLSSGGSGEVTAVVGDRLGAALPSLSGAMTISPTSSDKFI